MKNKQARQEQAGLPTQLDFDENKQARQEQDGLPTQLDFDENKQATGGASWSANST